MADRDYGRLYPVARAVLRRSSSSAGGCTRRASSTCRRGARRSSAVSVLDSFFLPLVLPRRITYVGKAEYLDDWKTRYLFPAMGMIPIDRKGGSAAQEALDTARVLGGASCSAYIPRARGPRRAAPPGPHGRRPSRSPHRRPDRPRRDGGHRDVQPPDAAMPRPFRPVWVNVGRPIDVSRYGDRSDDRLLLRQLTDEVMYEIRELSGQEVRGRVRHQEARGHPRETASTVIWATAPPTTLDDHLAEVLAS